MKLPPIICLLFSWFGPTSAQEISVVTVSEDTDALLPCSLGSEQKVEKFDWRKDNGENAKKEVFFYETGSHYNNDKFGQDDQFKQRVLFFENELGNGNASIKIEKTHLEDSGTYFCVIFEPHKKEATIRLNVGAAPEPHVKPIPKENERSLLECKVEGVPKPQVEWRNSAGEVLAKLTNVTKIKERFLKLYVNVTKSDNYTCVATQMTIHHQINNTLEVKFQRNNPTPGYTQIHIGWLILAISVGGIIIIVLLVIMRLRQRSS